LVIKARAWVESARYFELWPPPANGEDATTVHASGGLVSDWKLTAESLDGKHVRPCTGASCTVFGRKVDQRQMRSCSTEIPRAPMTYNALPAGASSLLGGDDDERSAPPGKKMFGQLTAALTINSLGKVDRKTIEHHLAQAS
jgi:hypothetical protein